MVTDKPRTRSLQKNTGCGIPTNCIFVDTETAGEKVGDYQYHIMKLAWTCAVRYSRSGEALQEIWHEWEKTYPLCQYIEKQARSKTPLYVFAHNIYFDIQSSDFIHYFTKWGWLYDFYYDQGQTYILKIVKGNRKVFLISTTNYFTTSAKALGELLDLPKLDIDFDKSSNEELSAYCRRDVEIIKKAMEFYFHFILKHDLGEFSLTRASQSFRAYRHRFMNTKIWLHNEEKVKELEREAYFGGRVECFFLGEVNRGPFVSLDVNSMYPFIMRFTPVPVKFLAYLEAPVKREWEWYSDKYAVVAEVVLKTDQPLYCVKKNGKLIFPTGEFVAFLCTPAFREAFNQSHIRKVKRIALYEKAVIFQEYVDYFYALKAEYKKTKQPILEHLVKIMLNSLYGKFAQRKMIQEVNLDITFDGYERSEVYNLVTGKQGIEYKMFNKHIIEMGSEDHPNSFCAISAHITEASRLYLWKLLKGVGLQRVLYCDTDSIKIRKRDLKYLQAEINEYKLGALKVEKEFKRLRIIGPKSYLTEDERVLKGIPHSAKLIGENTYAYQSFLRQATHMRKRIVRQYLIKNTTKKINEYYDKGVVAVDGKITPFRLSLPD